MRNHREVLSSFAHEVALFSRGYFYFSAGLLYCTKTASNPIDEFHKSEV